MQFDKNERIIIPDESGEEQLFEVLFYFDSDATGNSYIITSPVDEKETNNEEEGIEVYAFRYVEYEKDENSFELFQIEPDEEWYMVEEMFYKVAKEEE